LPLRRQYDDVAHCWLPRTLGKNSSWQTECAAHRQAAEPTTTAADAAQQKQSSRSSAPAEIVALVRLEESQRANNLRRSQLR
jgi:hypothetical protein